MVCDLTINRINWRVGGLSKTAQEDTEEASNTVYCISEKREKAKPPIWRRQPLDTDLVHLSHHLNSAGPPSILGYQIMINLHSTGANDKASERLQYDSSLVIAKSAGVDPA